MYFRLALSLSKQYILAYGKNTKGSRRTGNKRRQYLVSVELWEHQKQAVQKAKGLEHLALFMEVGTGKTATTVHILRDKYNAAKCILPTLVFCPPVVVKNWKREIQAHSKIPPEKILLLQGSGKKRLQEFEKMKKFHPKGFIAVTNYEAVQMKDLFEALKAWAPKILVCDESHRLKNPQALRTKKVIELADLTWFRYILTGTPILNNPMDIFSQYRVLDKGETFGKNFFVFRAKYFYDKNAGMPKQSYFPKWVPHPKTKEELGRLMERTSIQARKSECMTLPPLVRVRVEAELGKEQKKAYEEMLQEFITFIEETPCTAELAITKTLRLQQILSGFIRGVDGRDFRFKDNPRLSVLSDLLGDIAHSGKTIVWTNFRENYPMLSEVCKKLELPHVFITGEQNHKEKEASEEAFENDESIRVLIGNPAAGGEGVNLIAASNMVYYTRSYSRKHDVQSEARNYRGGSEKHQKITRYDLVIPGTLDEVVLDALTGKHEMAAAIMDFARGRR